MGVLLGEDRLGEDPLEAGLEEDLLAAAVLLLEEAPVELGMRHRAMELTQSLAVVQCS